MLLFDTNVVAVQSVYTGRERAFKMLTCYVIMYLLSLNHLLLLLNEDVQMFVLFIRRRGRMLSIIWILLEFTGH